MTRKIKVSEKYGFSVILRASSSEYPTASDLISTLCLCKQIVVVREDDAEDKDRNG